MPWGSHSHLNHLTGFESPGYESPGFQSGFKIEMTLCICQNRDQGKVKKWKNLSHWKI